MKKKLIILLLLFTVYYSKADNYPVGAENMGMANASVALPSVWSIYHNQAALAFLSGTNISAYYENRFNFPEFSVKSLASSIATKSGTFGFNYTNFGFSKYSDNKIGLAYALKIAKNISIGIQLDYFLIKQDNYYGDLSAISGEIGIYAEPFEHFHVGAHLFNPWRSKIATYQDERIPTIFKVGMAYDFSEETTISFETQKDFDRPVLIKTGIKFEPVNNFVLLAGVGFSQKNFFPAFGLTYNYKNIGISIAFENETSLGMKTGISISYRF